MAPPEDIPPSKAGDTAQTDASSPSPTDVILKIQQPHLSNILSGIKTYEFRKYLLPSSVQRVWFFLIEPVSSISYVAEISPAIIRTKEPSDVSWRLPEDGVGNREFNSFDEGWEGEDYAYKLGRVWRLEGEVGLQKLTGEWGLDERLRRGVETPRGLVERVKLDEGMRVR